MSDAAVMWIAGVQSITLGIFFIWLCIVSTWDVYQHYKHYGIKPAKVDQYLIPVIFLGGILLVYVGSKVIPITFVLERVG